ncbi:gluconolactonase [Actibacterium mucosum KCTC 23349]|uniref:Gluconolactonase n=2 Tax=Actibacterium TaxID=1433986 RepID=A0A037ZIV8_9RHOB|nr:gluconolactonase [Actibacterium mucosum KCTC 23349]
MANMYGPHLEVRDPAFRALCLANCHMEKLWDGGRWTEGPVYFGDGRYLLFSDIPNNRIIRFDETDNSTSVWRSPSRNSNGQTRDRQGRLISCEHSGRQVTRTEYDGQITVLASHFDGKRLNSPNDVVVSSDGAVWFTDPTYGIDGEYEGDHAISEIGGSHLYRIDPQTGAVEVACDDFVKPNGLAFSADESSLYVSDTGATHVPDGPRHIRRFDVANGKLSGGEVFSVCDAGLYDGFRLDVQGNIWASAADGVHCITPDGALIGKVLVNETVSNVCFGGPKRNRLYITATRSMWGVYMGVQGLPYF